MQILAAILFPWFSFWRINRPLAAAACVPMQLSFVLWPFAALWAVVGRRRFERDERIWAQVERRYARVACADAPVWLWYGKTAPRMAAGLIDMSFSGAALRVADADPKSIGSFVFIQLPGCEEAVTARVVRLTGDGLAVEFRPNAAEAELIRAAIAPFLSTR